MTQLAFHFPARDDGPQACGACVVWNGLATSATGSCSRLGERQASAPACPEFFPKHQLRATLYGRGAK